MNWGNEPAEMDGEEEEHGFARPFLASPSTAGSSLPGSDSRHAGIREGDNEGEADAVRPYFLTGGRVHDGVGGFERVYVLTPVGDGSLNQLTFELRQIAELCRQPQSVAEISALLGLPLGVATLLGRDLEAAGHLTAAVAAADPLSDLSLIKRLIHAVHAL